MLRRMRQHHLMRAGVELLAPVVLYLAATLVLILVFDQLMRLVAGGS
jgi:hypothetical protein